MINNKLFSVVIPAYNRSNEIKRAIDSVLRQTIQDFEILVVDDGSTDNTVEIVKTIKDNRIHILWQANSGATAARNNGIKHAFGKYVSFLDSDDEWLPEMLKRQLDCYEADDKVGCVYSNVSIIDSRGNKVKFGREFGIKGDCYKGVLQQGYLAPTTVLSAKREILLKVGMFDCKLPASQDDDVCFKLAKATRIAYIPDVMAYMYSGPDNRISKNLNKVATGWWMLWNKYEDDVINLCGKETMVTHIYDCMIRFAFAKNEMSVKEVQKKLSIYGVKLPLLKRILILMLTKSSGLASRIFYKVLRTI